MKYEISSLLFEAKMECYFGENTQISSGCIKKYFSRCPSLYSKTPFVLLCQVSSNFGDLFNQVTTYTVFPVKLVELSLTT